MVNLPDPVHISDDAFAAVLARHGLPRSTQLQPLPVTGIINTVYALGEHLVLRVPRANARFASYLLKEARVVPVARAVGVRTPALVAFDESLDLLPVPYALYQRVPGTALGLLDAEPGDAAHAWRELGRDLARLHVGGDHGLLDLPRSQRQADDDPRSLVERRAADGWLTRMEVRWLLGWLEHLAPLALDAADTRPDRLVHADTQPTNVMVDPDTLAYRAVIDWGDARCGDVAADFLGPPLRAVPFLLDGHREVAPLDSDDTAEARILWEQIRFALAVLPRGAAVGLSWGERPIPRLLEILRFFLETDDSRWTALAPQPQGGWR
ncbi:MAG TPA: phosphotransferase [Chloroflexota bacterium]|nr:phosphotransferase [Chloroflexota bacterium]